MDKVSELAQKELLNASAVDQATGVLSEWIADSSFPPSPTHFVLRRRKGRLTERSHAQNAPVLDERIRVGPFKRIFKRVRAQNTSPESV
jgi:hypothetical protein